MHASALIAFAAATAFVTGTAMACDDMKMSGGDDGGIAASRAPDVRPVSTAKAAEAPLVVKQKTPATRKTASAKPLPEGAVVARTGG